MNPHLQQPTSLFFVTKSICQHRHLIWQMSKREVVGRYRGSLLGLAWSFFNPILMLSVYTFVFSVVFKARWGAGGADGSESKTSFALTLFIGLIVYSLFSECVSRAPSLIVSNVSYVKKVIFPLEVLPVIALASSFFHMMISIFVWLIATLFLGGSLHWSGLLLPLILLPLMIGTLGIAWFLASIGVFVRDVGQTIGIILTVMMFMSPIFFPLSAIPEKFQFAISLNPLTFFIEQSRHLLIWGGTPDWIALASYLVGSLLTAWAGFWWFQKTRKGFADVI